MKMKISVWPNEMHVYIAIMLLKLYEKLWRNGIPIDAEAFITILYFEKDDVIMLK